MRNLLFRVIYYLTSVFFAITALPLLAIPSRQPLARWINHYTRVIVFWMRTIAGIKLTVRGREYLPEGPCIIASKHQSWGDGFCIFSQVDDLAFVTGNHLERIPLIGGILRKLGAIIVDNCGGALARAKLVDTELQQAKADSRRILIYPEGHLAPVGEKYRYKRGVYHMYKAYERPTVPVATNLGEFWPQARWDLKPGEAVIEFLQPIEPGLDKETFMQELEKAIETRSLALLNRSAKESTLNHSNWDRPALPDPRKNSAAAEM